MQTRRHGSTGTAVSAMWKLEDAKTRFSEVVRRAQRGVPQHVSVHGQDAVVVVSAAGFRTPRASRGGP
jgi:prevent-host-death family protein